MIASLTDTVCEQAEAHLLLVTMPSAQPHHPRDHAVYGFVATQHMARYVMDRDRLSRDYMNYIFRYLGALDRDARTVKDPGLNWYPCARGATRQEVAALIEQKIMDIELSLRMPKLAAAVYYAGCCIQDRQQRGLRLPTLTQLHEAADMSVAFDLIVN